MMKQILIFVLILVAMRPAQSKELDWDTIDQLGKAWSGCELDVATLIGEESCADPLSLLRVVHGECVEFANAFVLATSKKLQRRQSIEAVRRSRKPIDDMIIAKIFRSQLKRGCN